MLSAQNYYIKLLYLDKFLVYLMWASNNQKNLKSACPKGEKLMNKKLKIVLILAALIGALLLIGCSTPTTEETQETATAATWVVTEVATGEAVAEISWDGSNWSCTIDNCAQNRQIQNNTHHFFVGMVEVAVETGPGQLSATEGFTITKK